MALVFADKTYLHTFFHQKIMFSKDGSQKSEKFGSKFIQKENISFVIFSCMCFSHVENFDEMKDLIFDRIFADGYLI